MLSTVKPMSVLYTHPNAISILTPKIRQNAQNDT